MFSSYLNVTLKISDTVLLNLICFAVLPGSLPPYLCGVYTMYLKAMLHIRRIYVYTNYIYQILSSQLPPQSTSLC